MAARRKRVFSGIQPSGVSHIGNYLGAMLNWIHMEDTHECIYCVVDMHAITAEWLDPAELKAHPLRVGLSMNAVIDTREP